MASERFINELKKGAYENRLGNINFPIENNIDITIYGNSSQETKPSIDNPVDIKNSNIKIGNDNWVIEKVIKDGRNITTKINIQDNEFCGINNIRDEIETRTGLLKKRVRHLTLKVSDMNNSENYPGWKNVPFIKTDYPEHNASFSSFKVDVLCNITDDGNNIRLNTTGTNQTLYLSKANFNMTQTEWKQNYSDLIFDIYYVLSDFETVILQPAKLYEELNQYNHLSEIVIDDSCYNNGTIIGSLYNASADIKLINMPEDTNYVGEEIDINLGVKYDDLSTEFVNKGKFKIESLKEEETSLVTSFTAYTGGNLLNEPYKCTLDFENASSHTFYEFYQDMCNQLGLTILDEEFTNSSISITGNPFTNNETIRVALQEIEKVSCSIIKINWENNTIKLGWLDGEISYEFNPEDYSTLEGSLLQYGPLNEVILGNSQLDGENVVKREEDISDDDVKSIMIDASYFLYTQELRTQAIDGIFEKIKGLTYYDLKLTTYYGKPFLEIGNKIRINTPDGNVYDTYVLKHNLTYNGAFKSIIESPALTTEEQKYKNQVNSNTIKNRLMRTEVIVNKATGEITALTEKTDTIQDGLDNNYYTKTNVNELLQTAEKGITNTFSEAGGNNIFRNTGLWFETNDYEERKEKPYEYWIGKANRVGSEKAYNKNAILLQRGTFSQEQEVPDGSYTVSFKYNKKNSQSNTKVVINDIEYELNEDGDTEFYTGRVDSEGIYITQPLVVSSRRNIKVEFVSDTDNSMEIYDLMVNAGSVKLAYSQNQNETTTDTVNISKGIEIKSSDIDATFRADADGIRIYNRENKVTSKFTETGMENNTMVIKEEATITDILIQRVGRQVWFIKVR